MRDRICGCEISPADFHHDLTAVNRWLAIPDDIDCG